MPENLFVKFAEWQSQHFSQLETPGTVPVGHLKRFGKRERTDGRPPRRPLKGEVVIDRSLGVPRAQRWFAVLCAVLSRE